MSEVITGNKGSLRLWSPGQIYLGTFLTGPLTGCFLLSQNFKAFGEEGAAKKSLWTGILVTLFLILLLFILPDESIDKIPKHMIPSLYLGPMIVFTNARQKKEIKGHFSQEGKKQSHLKLLGVMLLSLLGVLLVGFIGAIAVGF